MIMNRRNNTLIIIFVAFIIILLTGIITYFLKEKVASSITTATAIIGAVAIWYQLKKDHDIERAQFIFNLNSTFSDDAKIGYIYSKYKEFRDDDSIVFTEDDGRKMGDYIMYFEIINYLLDDNIINIEMIDKLFTSRFFIMANNPYTQKYQLCHPNFTTPIFELYCKWYNFRIKHNKDIPYNKYALEKNFPDFFKINSKGELKFTLYRVPH